MKVDLHSTRRGLAGPMRCAAEATSVERRSGTSSGEPSWEAECSQTGIQTKEDSDSDE